MMRAVFSVVGIGASLVLLLSGCSSADETESLTQSASPVVTASHVPLSPLTAETPTTAASDAPATPEAAFLAKVRDILPDDTSIPNASDDQLIAAAYDACNQMATGLDSTLVSVINGEQKDSLGYYRDSARIGSVAKQTICP